MLLWRKHPDDGEALTYPYHVKIFMCPLSVYFTEDNPSNTLDDYLRDELNNGYILKSITDLPQIFEDGINQANRNRQIRVITEYNQGKARTHPAYGRLASPPIK